MQAVAEDGAARIEQLEQDKADLAARCGQVEQQMRTLSQEMGALAARCDRDKADLTARCERDKADLTARCGQLEQELHRLQAEKDAMMGCLLGVCGQGAGVKDALMGCLREACPICKGIQTFHSILVRYGVLVRVRMGAWFSDRRLVIRCRGHCDPRNTPGV